MKKILVTLMLCMISIMGIGQIQSIKPVESNMINDIIQYDSTKNFIEIDILLSTAEKNKLIRAYIGQELFVKPKNTDLRKYGYNDFYNLDAKYNYDTHNAIYEGLDGYNKIVNKTFVVDSVSYISMDNYWLFLHLKDSQNVQCKYAYDGRYHSSWPFIVMSYYNYIKTLVGKSYVIKNHYCHDIDVYTGDSIRFINKDYTTWKIADVTIEEVYGNLVLLINNGSQTSYINAEYIDKNDDGSVNVVLKSDWDKLVKTYGFNMMNAVMKREIRIGMPKKLVIMSWGEPDDINSSSYGPDQWVYDSQYLYIKNGKVESWN